MRDWELVARLKRIGTPAALDRLAHLKYLDAAARSREWKNGQRPRPIDPELFNITTDEEDEQE